MHWSKLRQLVEKRVAPSLAGRVGVMVTRYRHSHDQEGRWAIVVDGEEIGGFDTISTFGEAHRLADEIANRNGMSWLDAHLLAITDMQAQGRHSMEGFVNSLTR
jgi:hypothetical protein